jgi:hypothetical protein
MVGSRKNYGSEEGIDLKMDKIDRGNMVKICGKIEI